MYDYVMNELPDLIEATFPVTDQRSIFGHSMGGHSALVMALRHPERFKSVSAFSPIGNPVDCPWGQKAFAAYLGEDRSKWADYDASLLMQKATGAVPALVDQGEADGFLEEQLKPQTLEAAAKARDYPLVVNRRDGYDHSYYFIASFIEDHLQFHAKHLSA
jgi:S-formylglutathione hydrolase